METNLSPPTPARVDLSASTDTARLGTFGTVALMIAHCAGMVDLVALPVWVGTLIGAYRLDPQRAGLLATLFLAGAVLSSVFFSPRLNRLPARVMSKISSGSRYDAKDLRQTTAIGMSPCWLSTR